MVFIPAFGKVGFISGNSIGAVSYTHLIRPLLHQTQQAVQELDMLPHIQFQPFHLLVTKQPLYPPTPRQKLSLIHIYAAVPAGRCLPNFGGNRSYLLVDIGEHIGQIALDPSDQHILESLFDQMCIRDSPWTSDFTSNPLVGKLGVFRVQLDADEMTPHL